ncbi:acyl-CoA synthase [Planosporangium thailandense]|uniref:Acyl-CoA synthase n=1 Tax=Planosporangium thailandense TaxID=765197 RepID=A0ABX0XSF9_9ACTN|nr:SCP2 sterol-binding domain-containing protein [Planosporangium thailandense]NJC68908.1 acyl-CoA synthase [Planosporangium thailandense]
MTDITGLDFATVEPKQFAQIVKNTKDSEIAELLQGEHRKKILDAIFAKFPSLFRPDRAGSTSAVIHWNITGAADGGADAYELVIANGTCALSPSPENDPKLAITVGPVDFIKVVSGNGNPMMMFMTGKLKAKGDLGLAANIANLFEIPKA